MEQNTENMVGDLERERSYVACMNAGSTLVGRRMTSFLRHLWPLLLLDFVLTWLMSPVYVSHPINGGNALLWALCELVPVALSGMIIGQSVWLIKRYNELGGMPKVHPWQVWRDVMPYALGGVLILVCSFVVLAGIGIALSLIKMPLWASILTEVVVLTPLVILFTLISTQFMMTGCPIKKPGAMTPIPWNITIGTMAILIVCGLIFVGLFLLGKTPALAITYISQTVDKVHAIGDATDLPGNFPILRGLSFAIGTLVTNVGSLLVVAPMAYLWGSKQGKG